MRNTNTLDKLEFIWETVSWGFLVAWLYGLRCLSGIHGITVFQSKLVFAAMMLVLTAVGTAITFRRRRNRLSVAVNLMLPIELYTIVSTYRYIPVYCTAALAVALFVSLLYFLMIFLQKIDRKPDRKKILGRRLKFATLGSRTIVCVLLLALTVPLCVRTFLGYNIMRTNVPAQVDVQEADDWTMDNHMPTLAKLQQKEWEILSIQEKLDVLGTVKNIELQYFGINHEVYLEAGQLDENTLGNYDEREHRITIDLEHLKSDSAESVLGTLLHECMHVYQFMSVEAYEHIDEEYRNMLMFYSASRYQEEFNNYVSGSDNAISYYFQKCETDARDYAEYACEVYYKQIKNYLIENSQSMTQDMTQEG